MPIIQNGSYYLYRKNYKKRQKFNKFIPILLFFCIVFAVFGTFYIFSQLNFADTLNINKCLIFEKKSYFVLSIFSGEREEVVSQQSASKANGAAGYVYEYDGKYYLIANIYESKSDAEIVAEKLIDYQTEILEIKLDNMILAGDYSSKQLSTLKYSLGQVNRAYNYIFNVISLFDHGEILEGEAKQKLQIFANSCQEDREMLANVFPSCCDNVVVYAKIFCNQTVSNISTTSLSTNFSSDSKMLLTQIVFNFFELQKNVKK